MNRLKTAILFVSITTSFCAAVAQQPLHMSSDSSVKCRIAKRTFLRNPENNYYDVVYDINDGAGEQVLESRGTVQEAQILLAQLVNAGKCSLVE